MSKLTPDEEAVLKYAHDMIPVLHIIGFINVYFLLQTIDVILTGGSLFGILLVLLNSAAAVVIARRLATVQDAKAYLIRKASE